MDEMHAQKNRNLYEVLWRSMIKRLEPLMLILTHAGHDDEGICYEEYDYAKRVLAGSTFDDGVLPVIFEARPDEDPFAESTWRRVNPGHGVTVQHDEFAQAREGSRDDGRGRAGDIARPARQRRLGVGVVSRGLELPLDIFRRHLVREKLARLRPETSEVDLADQFRFRTAVGLHAGHCAKKRGAGGV
jgi:hypothetical protein